MARNPYINKYKKYLQKEERQRKSFLNNRRKNNLLKGVAVGVGVAAAGHYAHADGIVGAINDASKYTLATTNATRKAFDSIGGAKAFTDPLSFKGLDLGSYMNDIEDYRYETIPRISSRIDEFKSTFRKSFNENLERSNELYIDKLRKETDRLADSAQYEYRRSLVYEKVDEVLEKTAKENPNAVKKVRDNLNHRIADLAFESRDKARTEFKRIGMNDDTADFMLGVLNSAKQDVNEFVNKMDTDSFKENIKDTVIDNIIKERQDEVNRGISSRVTKTIRGMAESAFGYRKATISDIEKMASDSDSIDVSNKTLEFLKKIKNKGADAKKFVPDDDILVKDNKLVSAIDAHKQMQQMRDVFSEGILGHILYQRDMKLTREYSRKAGLVMRSGYHNFGLADTSVVGQDFRLKETLYGIGDSAYKVKNVGGKNLRLEKVKDGLEFTSGRFSSTQRLMTQMSGINAPEFNKWWESKVLDIAERKQPSPLQKMKSIFTKFDNKEWMPNRIKGLISELEKEGSSVDPVIAKRINNYISENAAPMPSKVMNRLAEGISDTDLKFDTQDELVESYVKLSKLTSDGDYSEDLLRGKALNILNQKRVVQRKGILDSNKLENGENILKKQVGNMLIKNQGVQSTMSLANEMLESGDIILSQHKETGQAITSHIIDRAFSMSAGEFTDPIKKAFRGETEFGFNLYSSVSDMLSKSHPSSGLGPVDEYQNAFHGDILALNKMTPQNITDVFTAGRKNMGDVNKGTLLTYGVLSRVNDLIKDFSFLPLGLSDESMGSTKDVIKNAFTKRILPIYAGIETAKYINDYSKEWTGYTLEQREERTKAHTRLSIAGLKDSTGITSVLKQLDKATPGSEGLETFLKEAPMTGPTAPLFAAGQAAKWTGLFSNRSQEEWIDYYKHGKDPVRKNRFWIMGKTPWMGEGISHYKPNSYKMAMSEWQYTDTVYGSRENYWSHSFLPTPRHPFAPIRRYITDPYWFEDMHKKDRPYPRSGGLFDSDTPWGMLGNITIGNILKPQKDYGAGATEEDLKEQADKNYYPKFTLGQYKGGDLNLFDYTPKFAMGNKESLKSVEGINAEILAKGRASRADSALRRSVGLSQDEGRAIALSSSGSNSRGRVYVGDNEGVRSININADTVIESPNVVDSDQGRTLNVSGNAYSMDSITAINNTIKDKGKTLQILNEDIENTGVMIGHRTPFSDQDPNLDIQDPSTLNYQVGRALDIASEIPGARTFVAETVMGGNDYGEGSAVLEDAGMGYHWSSRVRGMEIGGRGGALSEVARRLWTKKPGLTKEINNVPNMMTDWMPNMFQTGDPYRAVDGGEYRMPGDAYESLNTLHPDKFGKYGAVDRAAILADVAPWSQEYKFWLKIARSQNLEKKEKEFLKRSLERTKKQTDDLHLTDYKFLDDNLTRKSFEVDKFLDSNRFTVRGSDKTFRLAGLHNSFDSKTEKGVESLRILEENMLPGNEITVVYNENSEEGSSTPAVVYSNEQNINKMLIDTGATKRNEDGPISSYVDMNFLSRGVGHAWEYVAHKRIPFVQNKILNVNSPMEHYKEFGLYGKGFQSWQEPIEDFIIPEYQSAIARHPFGATAGMGFVGGIAGWLLAGKSGMKALSTVGGLSGAFGSITRMASETESGKAWIPERREEEREINEYFDRLKYLKYKRLYNKYKELAKVKEGINLEDIIEKLEEVDSNIADNEEKAKNTIEKIKRTGKHNGEGVKKVFNKNGKVEYTLATDNKYLSNVRSSIKEKVSDLKGKDILVGLGPYAKKAVEYRNKFKSTLFAVDGENISVQKIMGSLPVKDREYFKNFIKENDPEKRKQILKLVPDNQKRAYQMLWGMDPEDEESMAEFFEDFYLPDEDWLGWKEGIDLEDSQIKTIENQGLDEKDFGLWKDHTEDEKLTPAPAPASKGYDIQNYDIGSIRNELQEILSDYDLDDLEIEITPTERSGISVDLQVIQNRKKEVEDKIREVMGA